jgi:hypothetical protein
LSFDWSHIIEHLLLRGGNNLEDPVFLYFVKIQQKGLQTGTAASRRLFYHRHIPYKTSEGIKRSMATSKEESCNAFYP